MHTQFKMIGKQNHMQVKTKKKVLFSEIGRERISLSFTRPHSQMCIRIYIFNFNNYSIKRKKRKKVKQLKKKTISVESLTRYNDIVCEFALCTFNILDRGVNFSWLFI